MPGQALPLTVLVNPDLRHRHPIGPGLVVVREHDVGDLVVENGGVTDDHDGRAGRSCESQAV